MLIKYISQITQFNRNNLNILYIFAQSTTMQYISVSVNFTSIPWIYTFHWMKCVNNKIYQSWKKLRLFSVSHENTVQKCIKTSNAENYGIKRKYKFTERKAYDASYFITKCRITKYKHRKERCVCKCVIQNNSHNTTKCWIFNVFFSHSNFHSEDLWSVKKCMRQRKYYYLFTFGMLTLILKIYKQNTKFVIQNNDNNKRITVLTEAKKNEK